MLHFAVNFLNEIKPLLIGIGRAEKMLIYASKCVCTCMQTGTSRVSIYTNVKAYSSFHMIKGIPTWVLFYITEALLRQPKINIEAFTEVFNHLRS